MYINGNQLKDILNTHKVTAVEAVENAGRDLVEDSYTVVNVTLDDNRIISIPLIHDITISDPPSDPPLKTVKAVWLKDGRGYLTGHEIMHQVPVQYGKWSRKGRLIKILAIYDKRSDRSQGCPQGYLRIECQIAKNMISAGRKFSMSVQMEAVEKVIE